MRAVARLSRLATPLFTATRSFMPEPPYTFGLSASVTLDLTTLNEKIVQAEERRQQAFEISNKIQPGLVRAKSNQEKISDECDELVQNIIKESVGRQPREANLSSRVEDYTRYRAFQHFLETGSLLEPIDGVTDEEYLGGACMGLCQDLQRYGLGRATVRDVESVQAAADLVSSILDYLLEFDFRNGSLRRKYDGTKYSLKALETLLYELAVTGSASTDTPDAKRQKKELLPMEKLMKIKEHMDHRDQLREDLIKKCRDAQKAAKQAIFALHRGDTEKAKKLMEQCQQGIIKDLQPIVDEEPPLRGGSYANVLEEYVEAKLFYAWLHDENGSKEEETSPAGTLLTLDQFGVDLEPEDYLGGLSDLTGEVGRFAVQRGTARDVQSVQLCLQTNRSILTAMETLDRLPQGIYKKMDQTRRSVEKLERMLYEMSLSEATGRNVKSEMEEENGEDS